MGIRGVGVVGAVVAAVLLVTGCSVTGDAPAPNRTEAARATPTATPTPTPTPTATRPAIASPAERTVTAGRVADGSSASASGSGDANVAFTSSGPIAVVVELDCSACTGTATVTAPGRMSPFGRASAPLRASFLTGVLSSDGPEQSVIVEARGSWSVTLRSWNDLPLVSGAQSGKGPAVLFFSDDVSHVTVDYRPAGSGDSFSGRVFTTSGRPQLFGDSGAFARSYDVDLPGVMAIQTNGTWTVTPTP
ncbi:MULTISPECIES: hypothetical protein [unclassified Curtobacterium]|uniref:hypothetical protein n=1 Tax=unclassified Curtobacterium TaxID=257496 RepID=UPI0008DCCE8A|nr:MULTISPECIES: hypothetical protein [unclassified Curtobacterium]OII11069.1 hypothetical protein BIU97_09490 [Curtobacterium sp. MCBA15_009]